MSEIVFRVPAGPHRAGRELRESPRTLVAVPAVANALRLSMRLLEDAADAAHVVGALLERPDGRAVMDRMSSESG
ncbi:hypothetical protein ACTWQE_16285 [Streptomyces sp. 8N706]